MSVERFSHEEAVHLFSQEAEPPTAVDRLSSMVAIFNTLSRGGFPTTQLREVDQQLTFLARGIVAASQEERSRVDEIIRGYRKDLRRDVQKLGKRLREKINAVKVKN